MKKFCLIIFLLHTVTDHRLIMMIYCDDLHLTDVKFLVYYLYIELKSVVIDNFFTIRYLN